MELKAPHAQQGQGGADLVARTMEQPAVVEPAAPTMEEPLVTGLTSSGSGAHDKGDPGDEGLWSTVAMSTDPAEAEVGATGDASSSVAQDPPTVAE